MPTQHRTTCSRDCPDTCSIIATVDAGRVVALRGDPDHPVTRGALCHRTNQYLRTQYSSDRLTQPLLRKSGTLTPVSWDEALDFIALGLEQTKREWGPASIIHYRSGGSLGISKLLCDYFFSLYGPATIKRGDICSGAGEAAQVLDFGVSESSDIFTLLDSKHILVWGRNLVTSSPHTLRVVRDARKRGARVTLIDPVCHATAQHSDDYIQLRPSGDFALAMAVARLCFENGFIDPHAADYCDGLTDFRVLAEQRSVADWCADAEVTTDQAQAIAQALGHGPTAILVGWGLARRSDGGTTVRALDALGAITGNIGIPGGGVSYYFRRRGAFDLEFTQPNPPPRTVCEPRLAHDIAALRDPPARALWVTSGNPVTMLPDSEHTARVIRELPLSVVVDMFLTDTAREATVVLPTISLLEADDIYGAYGHHYLGVSQPVVAAPSGVKSDLEIMQALAGRLSLGAELAGTAREWKRRLVAGRLGALGVNLETIERGNFRNPLAQPIVFEGRKFATASGKVNLLREPPPQAARPTADYPLALLAMSTPKSQCSQWADVAPSPLPLTVHPSAAPSCQDGEVCDIESVLGRMPVRLHFDPRQRPDVALLPKGGARSAEACANGLIRAKLTDLGEGAALYEEHIRLVPRSQH